MHVALLPLLLSQAADIAEAAPAAPEKAANSGAGVQEKILHAGSTEQLMQNVMEIGQEYLIPFAIQLLAAVAIFVIGRWVAMFVTAQARRLMTR
ncbi:MAG: hypothetical protein ACC645_28560, partial [Pirellulales bacterium]